MGINVGLARERIDVIFASVRRLQKLAVLPLDEFVADPDYFAIAAHHLRRALEALFDIGRHIIAKEGWGHPQDYRSIIMLLGQKKVIPLEFARQISGMAGYRNRLVHGYAEVSPEEMHGLLRRRLDDLDAFCRHVLGYLSDLGFWDA